MAVWQILPGGGSRYTSETLAAIPSSNIMADELIINENTELVIQQQCLTGIGGTFQPQERLTSSSTWVPFGIPINAGDGFVSRYTNTSRPLSRLRFDVTNLTGLSATVTFTLVIQGFGAGGSRF